MILTILSVGQLLCYFLAKEEKSYTNRAIMVATEVRIERIPPCSYKRTNKTNV
jgi:hypothetical protein